MLIDFVIPAKGESLITAYQRWRGWADPKVCCDYALHMAVTSWSEEVARELPLVTGEEVGINSFKVFMAYKDVMMLQDDEIIEVFKVRIVKYTMLSFVCVCHLTQTLEDVIISSLILKNQFFTNSIIGGALLSTKILHNRFLFL